MNDIYCEYSPLGLTQYTLSTQDGNDRSRRSVERDNQTILGKRWVWHGTKIVLIERHDRVDTVCERRDRILLKHELRGDLKGLGLIRRIL